jgi:hypothetical protein
MYGPIMEPHSNIAHNRRKHIDLTAVSRFLCEKLCFYVPMWFKTDHGSVMRISQ